jgi:hypothetical protein
MREDTLYFLSFIHNQSKASQNWSLCLHRFVQNMPFMKTNAFSTLFFILFLMSFFFLFFLSFYQQEATGFSNEKYKKQ